MWWLTLWPHGKKCMGLTLVCLSVTSLHAFPFCVGSNWVLWLPPTFQMHVFCIGPVRECLLPCDICYRLQCPWIGQEKGLMSKYYWQWHCTIGWSVKLQNWFVSLSATKVTDNFLFSVCSSVVLTYILPGLSSHMFIWSWSPTGNQLCLYAQCVQRGLFASSLCQFASR